MARIKAGGLISGISGCVGGSKYGRNRGQLQVQKRPARIIKDTPGAIEARQRLARATEAWGNLTQEEQRNWNTLAAKVKRYNRLGEVRTQKGKDLFVSHQTLYLGWLGFIEPPAPIFNKWGGLENVSLEFTQDNYYLRWDRPTELWLNFILIYGARTFKTGGYGHYTLKYFTWDLAGVSDEVDLKDDWASSIGELAQNENFVIGIRVFYFGGLFSPLKEYRGRRE